MSIETTKARADLRAHDGLWRVHKAGCYQCSRAAKARRWGELCSTGGRVYADRLEAAAELQRQRSEDQKPAPGQAELPLGVPPRGPERPSKARR